MRHALYALIVAAICSTTTFAQSRASVEIRGEDLSGVSRDLASLRGRVVVLVHVDQGCEPCGRANDLQTEYGAWGLKVIGLTDKAALGGLNAAVWAKSKAVNFEIWIAEPGGTEDIRARSILVIDREGGLAMRSESSDWRGVENVLDALLDGEAASAKPHDAAKVPS